MPLNDAVERNCKNGATAETQGAVVKYIIIIIIWSPLCKAGIE